jgi:GT2 family glycosyltransferase
MTDNPLVYVVVVNFNGWHHTIECLEGLYRQGYTHFKVIVIDNASMDGSVEMLRAWAEGRLDIYKDPHNPLRAYCIPPISKPLRYGNFMPQEPLKLSESGLALVVSKKNLGFAGANNLGISLALSDPLCRYIWLLNNDTVVSRDALTALVKKAEDSQRQDKMVGMIGSKLPRTSQTQCCGREVL